MLIKVAKLWLPISFVVVVVGGGGGGGGVACVSTLSSGLLGFAFRFSFVSLSVPRFWFLFNLLTRNRDRFAFPNNFLLG